MHQQLQEHIAKKKKKNTLKDKTQSLVIKFSNIPHTSEGQCA